MKIVHFPNDSSLQFLRIARQDEVIEFVFTYYGRSQRFLISKVLNVVCIALVELTNQGLVITPCFKSDKFSNFTNLADQDPELSCYRTNIVLLYDLLVSTLNASFIEQTDDNLNTSFDFKHNQGFWPVEVKRVANFTLVTIQRTESATVQFMVFQTLKSFKRLTDSVDHGLQLNRLQRFVQTEFDNHIIVEDGSISDFFQSGNLIDYPVMQQYRALRRFM
jgi:hypothetical protein